MLASAAALALACSESAGPTPTPGAEELAAQGKQAYLSNCIACHNADPTVDGALGPAVAGASASVATRIE